MTTKTLKAYGHEIKMTQYPMGFGQTRTVLELNGEQIAHNHSAADTESQLEWMIDSIVETATGEEL